MISCRIPGFALLFFSLLAGGTAPVSAEVFNFAWPTPARVTVTATINKKGDTSTARYLVSFDTEDSAHYLLSFSGFEFLSLNGLNATEPAVKARLGPIAVLTGAMPTMRLGLDGSYLGTIGLGQMLSNYLELLSEQADDALRQRFNDYFASPEVQGMLQQKAGETWNTWVGAWNGLDLAASQSLRGRVPITIVGRDLEQSILVEHLGPVRGTEADDCPVCVRLRMTTVVEGAEVLELVSSMMRDLGADGARRDTGFVSARSMSVTEIVTDPATLMPRFVVVNTEVMLQDANAESVSQHERKAYYFDW